MRFSIVNRYPRNQRLIRDELELFPEDDDDPLDEDLPEDCPDRGAELLPLPPSRRTVGVYARPCVFDRVSLVGVLIWLLRGSFHVRLTSPDIRPSILFVSIDRLPPVVDRVEVGERVITRCSR